MKEKRSPFLFAIIAVVVLVVALLALRSLPLVPTKAVVAPLRSGAASSTHQDPNPDVPPQAAAVVTDLSGNVVVTRTGARVPAASRMELVSGDVVTVPQDGSLTITWPNYGRSYIEGGTRFTLSQAFESTDRSRFLVRMTLSSGSIWSEVVQSPGAGSGFSVRSGNVLVTSPGSAFHVKRDSAAGPVTVASFASYTDVFRVEDRLTTPQERQAGATVDTLEHVVGGPRELAPGTGASFQDGSTDLPKAVPVAASDASIAQRIASKLQVSDADLEVTPTDASSASSGS